MGWDNQAITQLIVTAAAKGSGVFVYSGAPAAGNLVVTISGDGVEHDQYGNTYAGVFQAGGTTINAAGDLFQFNIFGAQTSYLQSSPPVLIFYKDTGTAVQGAVAFAFATAPYTDAFSNVIQAGVTLAEQAPATMSGRGQMYVGDGTGGSTAGVLYYLSPAGNYFTVAGP